MRAELHRKNVILFDYSSGELTLLIRKPQSSDVREDEHREEDCRDYSRQHISIDALSFCRYYE
jgi:hypothetical protein